MKSRLTLASLLVLTAAAPGLGQAPPPPPAAPPPVAVAPAGQKTLAATIQVYVFPSKGQSPKQQSVDEADCYQWAVGNTGTDPFQLAQMAEQEKQQAAQAQATAATAGRGARAKGALAGAAAGALIGEIASDDAGEGAAVGAAVGMAAGGAARRGARRQAQGQAQAQSAQAQQSLAVQMDNFKKAFSVCLEGKHYLVKY